MSNVPQAARRQVEEANRMAQALKAGQDPNALPGATPLNANTPPQPAAVAPLPEFPSIGAAVPPDAKPVAPGQIPKVKVAAPNQPRAAAPAPAPSAPPADATPAPAVDHEHRFKVLQGKYNAEKRAAQAEIARLQEQNARIIASLGTAPAAPAAHAPAPAAPLTLEQRAERVGITRTQIAEFGPELVEMMLTTAERIAGPRIAQLEREHQRLAGAVQTTVANVNRTARELVYDALESQVTDWATVNDSQEFLDWLDTVDVISGQTRRTGLMRAFELNDATRVVGIFRAFLAEDERTRSTSRTQRVDPETLIAPGQPAGGGTPAPLDGNQSGRIWLESEIENFYSLVRQNHFKHKPDERKALEAEIMSALAEGRIRPTINDQSLANAR
jgi:hypothetical protein